MYFVTDYFQAVVLMWVSVACFGGRVSLMFHPTCMFVHWKGQWFLPASPAGCKPAGEEVLASQKPNVLPTELSSLS